MRSHSEELIHLLDVKLENLDLIYSQSLKILTSSCFPEHFQVASEDAQDEREYIRVCEDLLTVTSQLGLAQVDEASASQKVAEFFRKSAGEWRSQRRYYTLPDGETKEMISYITIRFLEMGCDELRKLAELHQLSDPDILTCGAEVSWESQDSVSQKKQSTGATMFGVAGSTLYRDRGFATTKPVTAEYYFLEPETMCLRTEYNGSVFEEQLKLIGDKYRTRQTIISRAGEQQMIGQYLEKRVE